MTSTVFQDFVTPVPASWLNDVNTSTYTTVPAEIARATAAENARPTSATLAAAGGAALIGNTPAGNIASTTVQAALNELDVEKALLAGAAAQTFSVGPATLASHAVRADQILGVLATPSRVRVHTSNGYGSTNTVIRRFTTVVDNVGTDITYADSATLGATFTINTSGVYAIVYSDAFNAAADMGVSLNSNQLTTSIINITAADRLALDTGAAVNNNASASSIIYIPAGSVIRAHTDGTPSGVTSRAQFTITMVAKTV